jgi:hypothetical protein
MRPLGAHDLQVEHPRVGGAPTWPSDSGRCGARGWGTCTGRGEGSTSGLQSGSKTGVHRGSTALSSCHSMSLPKATEVPTNAGELAESREIAGDGPNESPLRHHESLCGRGPFVLTCGTICYSLLAGVTWSPIIGCGHEVARVEFNAARTSSPAAFLFVLRSRRAPPSW